MTQKDKIYDLLEDRKPHTNRELNQICFRYGARLAEIKEEIKEDGYEIKSKPIGNKGLWTYEMREVENEQDYDLVAKYGGENG